MEIQKAKKENLKKILNLQYLAYQSEAKLLNNYKIPPLMQTYEDIELEYKKGVILKALNENGEIIGSIRAYNENGSTFVNKVIVNPKWQGQGIGTSLLYAIEKECPAERYELFTSTKSVKNIQLYERIGYKGFMEKEVSPGLTFIYMEKYLR